MFWRWSQSFLPSYHWLAKRFQRGTSQLFCHWHRWRNVSGWLKPDLNNVFITVPENYSGNVNFKVAGVSTKMILQNWCMMLLIVTIFCRREQRPVTLVEDEITTWILALFMQTMTNFRHAWIAKNQAAGANYTFISRYSTSVVLLAMQALPNQNHWWVDYHQLTGWTLKPWQLKVVISVMVIRASSIINMKWPIVIMVRCKLYQRTRWLKRELKLTASDSHRCWVICYWYFWNKQYHFIIRSTGKWWCSQTPQHWLQRILWPLIWRSLRLTMMAVTRGSYLDRKCARV